MASTPGMEDDKNFPSKAPVNISIDEQDCFEEPPEPLGNLIKATQKSGVLPKEPEQVIPSCKSKDRPSNLKLRQNHRSMSLIPFNLNGIPDTEQLAALELERQRSVIKGVNRMSYAYAKIDDGVKKMAQIYRESKKEYELVINKKNLKGYKKKVEGSPVLMVRCDLHCKNVKPYECFQMIYNFDIRKSWDKALPKLKVIETVDENTDFIYSMFKVFCLV